MSQQTTALQALMHLLKAYIGTGILAMPKAFSYSGIIIGCIGTPFIGLLCHCCIHMLIDINEHLCQKLGTEPLDFEELAERALIEGPERLRKYSKLAKYFVIFFLFVAQMGFCCAYFLFIADNIQLFLVELNVKGSASLSIQYYLLMLLPFLILISFVKSIKYLSIASMCANVVIVASFVIIVYNLVTGWDTNGSIGDRKLLGSEVPLFFSTTMFTYEGITVTMPLYRSMKRRENFGKTFGVINIAIVIVMFLYTTVGLLGYLKYGEDVAASITLSLPNEPMYISVQIMYALAITISYPVQLYVAIHLIWPFINNKLQEHKVNSFTVNISDYMFRATLVLFTFALAAIIPKLDLILSLIGAISCSSDCLWSLSVTIIFLAVLLFKNSTVAIMFPPIVHTIAFWEVRTEFRSRLWICTRNGVIIIFGIIGFTTGTYFSLQNIIISFSSDSMNTS